MSTWYVVWPGMLLLGAVLGFCGGLLGIGGGILAIPALALWFGMDQSVAQGTALVMIAPNVVMAFWRYSLLFRKEVYKKHGMRFGLR